MSTSAADFFGGGAVESQRNGGNTRNAGNTRIVGGREVSPKYKLGYQALVQVTEDWHQCTCTLYPCSSAIREPLPCTCATRVPLPCTWATSVPCPHTAVPPGQVRVLPVWRHGAAPALRHHGRPLPTHTGGGRNGRVGIRAKIFNKHNVIFFCSF